ncbi:hypothetical protein [Mycolicibacterium conceptionense]|uniref:hypothetical protein n=1 Tax=Mycolicibacterium conceptionense TaxID=451644 RepID=UPI00104275FE|nr:hypothetical protein [Mycolicibacterium conceptionense]
MTNIQPHYPGQWPGRGNPQQQWPPQPVTRQRVRRVRPFVIGRFVLAAVVLGGIAAVAAGLFGRDGSAGDADSISRVSGDRAQWTAAVCADNSDLATSSNFLYPDATNIAYCATKPSQGEKPQPVVIGEWPRDADVEADIARLKSVQWFATGTAGGHTTVFILLDSPDRTLLEPLTSFGFTIRGPA